MKKELITALFALTLTGTALAGDPFKTRVSEPDSQNKKESTVKKSEVWAEEKLGTYRGNRIARFLLGECRPSSDLCMIIFHPDMNPDGTTAVRVFPPNQRPITYQVESCTRYTEETTTGPVEHFNFILSE